MFDTAISWSRRLDPKWNIIIQHNHILVTRSNNKMVFEGLIKSYDDLLTSGDERSNQLPFIRTPIYAISAVVMYIVMVIVGPRLMEKREAFQIRRLLIVYNFLSTLLSLYMAWEVCIMLFLQLFLHSIYFA